MRSKDNGGFGEVFSEWGCVAVAVVVAWRWWRRCWWCDGVGWIGMMEMAWIWCPASGCGYGRGEDVVATTVRDG
uniref:Uncharacterized protein n=1 Tax=Tanacetum cinerariifolium TaxID=118510 RepID=A0A699JFN4_TANCI|nr:hypothetical protein [Tanacetum cinerariifolium]